jgi:hypothetical protein
MRKCSGGAGIMSIGSEDLRKSGRRFLGLALRIGRVSYLGDLAQVG